MKKELSLFMTFIMSVAILTGCSKDEFMGVSLFTENFNTHFQKGEISLSSYIIHNELYSLHLTDGEESMLLTAVTEGGGYIEEIRITVSKIDSRGMKKPIKEKRKAFFLSVLKSAVMAYTYLNEQQAQSIIDEMKLNNIDTYSQVGEKTTERGYFHFVHYSTELVSMFRIFNIHLHPTEKTEKPESRPAFGNTTNIRTETVPLK